MWTHRWFSRPQLGGTHSECEVNQTSDLLLYLHGTFSLHKAPEGDLIRPGFSVENSQKCDFTHTWQFDCDQIVILHTYPLTDSGNSIMMFAFTLTGLMFCCTLVLKYKSYLFVHVFHDVSFMCNPKLWMRWQNLRLELQVNVNLCGVQRHVLGAQDDIKCHLIKEANINCNQCTAVKHQGEGVKWPCTCESLLNGFPSSHSAWEPFWLAVQMIGFSVC